MTEENEEPIVIADDTEPVIEITSQTPLADLLKVDEPTNEDFSDGETVQEQPDGEALQAAQAADAAAILEAKAAEEIETDDKPKNQPIIILSRKTIKAAKRSRLMFFPSQGDNE